MGFGMQSDNLAKKNLGVSFGDADVDRVADVNAITGFEHSNPIAGIPAAPA